MPDINLTEQEVQTLLRCLNDRIEPPEELAKKLFPKLYAGFDFKTLNRASIPTIEYAGKRSEAAILNEASAFGAGSPLQIVRFFRGGKLQKEAQQLELIKETGPTWETGWKNMIVQGDNLQFLKTCFLDQDPLIRGKVKGKVRLFYMDPPFATQADFEGRAGESSYADRIDRSEFIEQLRERLIFVREILARDGHVFMHLDYRMNHHVRTVMDEIFRESNFRNEIMLPGRASKNLQQQFEQISRLNVRHDYLLWYSASAESKVAPLWVEKHNKGNPEGHWHHFWSTADRPTMRYRLFGVKPESGQWVWEEMRALRAGENHDRYLSEGGGRSLAEYWQDTGSVLEFIRKSPDDGKPQYWRSPAEIRLADTVWAGLPIYDNSTKYPTEKNEKLLEQIISFVTAEGDLVMDPFGGSGTTAAVAEKLGRRWITCDFGKHAIYTMQRRMATISESQKLGLPPEQRKKKRPYGDPPKDFCVVSVGAFDFSKIMDLRRNRDAYIAFVLGIFGITERDDQFAKKYRVSNVVAQKDGNPVEVYPVWEDDYLRKVRVDTDYLKGILDQAGGKLKGDYYIVSPESCVRVGTETAMKNAKGEKVTFHMLTFPYKVLEDAARNFQLSEQPSAPENINQLISSVGFYFNEEVEIKAKKTAKGFKVMDFKTTILNAGEERYEGLDGLAMILVDTGYDGETFNVDACVYQKDMKDGEVALKGVNGKTAIIAVDKHGNESKVTAIQK